MCLVPIADNCGNRSDWPIVTVVRDSGVSVRDAARDAARDAFRRRRPRRVQATRQRDAARDATQTARPPATRSGDATRRRKMI
jgi:hypothetical protein